MFFKKYFWVLFLVSTLTHVNAIAPDQLRDNLKRHSYSRNSAMGSIATEVGKLVTDNQLEQTWGDSFARTVNGTSHGFAKRQANQVDLTYIIPALAAIAVKNPKRDMWEELSRGNISAFTPEQQEHILNAYTIISLFQKLNENGLLSKEKVSADIQDTYNDLLGIYLTETLNESFRKFGNVSLKEKVTRFAKNISFAMYIPAIPEPLPSHYSDIHVFHKSFNPRAANSFADAQPKPTSTSHSAAAQAHVSTDPQFQNNGHSISLGSKSIDIEAIQIAYIGDLGARTPQAMAIEIFDTYLKPDLGSMDSQIYGPLCHHLRDQFVQRFTGLIFPSQKTDSAVQSASAAASQHQQIVENYDFLQTDPHFGIGNRGVPEEFRIKVYINSAQPDQPVFHTQNIGHLNSQTALDIYNQNIESGRTPELAIKTVFHNTLAANLNTHGHSVYNQFYYPLLEQFKGLFLWAYGIYLTPHPHSAAAQSTAAASHHQHPAEASAPFAAAPNPKASTKEIVDYVLRPYDKNGANPIIDGLNIAFEGIMLEGPNLIEQWNQEGSLMRNYDEGRNDYGNMLPAGFHVYMLDWLRSQRQRGQPTPGFLDLESIHYFQGLDTRPYANIPQSELRINEEGRFVKGDVPDVEGLQKFVDNAKISFDKGYNIHAGVVRSGDRTGRGAHHYFTVAVTRNSQTKKWHIYAINSTGGSIKSEIDASKESTLYNVADPLHEYITTKVTDIAVDPISLEDIHATGFQSATAACGIWAALSARAVCEAGSIDEGVVLLKKIISENEGNTKKVEEVFAKRLRKGLLKIHELQQNDGSLTHAIAELEQKDRTYTETRTAAIEQARMQGIEFNEERFRELPQTRQLGEQVELANKHREAVIISSLKNAVVKFVTEDNTDLSAITPLSNLIPDISNIIPLGSLRAFNEHLVYHAINAFTRAESVKNSCDAVGVLSLSSADKAKLESYAIAYIKTQGLGFM